MKNLILCLTCVFIISCDKSSVNSADSKEFEHVYIVQAGRNPVEKQLPITEDIQEVHVNVGLGGLHSSSSDVKVSLIADMEMVATFNEAHNTDYLTIPSGSFQLEKDRLTILKGQRYSELATILLTTVGFIDPGEAYLLPIRISTADQPVSEKNNTAYFLIKGEYPLGEAPPVKAFEIGDKPVVSFFTYGQFLVIHDGLGQLLTYSFNAVNKTFNSEYLSINHGWNIFNKVLPFSDGVIGRWADSGNIWEYTVDKTSGVMGGDYMTKGVGFDTYNRVLYSEHLDALLCISASGDAFIVQKENGTWSNIQSIADEWDIYREVITYGSGVLAIDEEGDLWYMEIASDYAIGEPQKVGSGWNRYASIASYGTDLLAIDSQKNIWLYEFDLSGFWTVK